MCSYVENWRTVKPFSFVHNCIQKCDFVLSDFCSEFNSSVMIIRLFNEVCYLFFSGPGGHFEKNWVGVSGTLPKTLQLF